jgi:hypothetical protein
VRCVCGRRGRRSAREAGTADSQRRDPGIHGVLVVHHGKTIAEWYVPGTDEMIGDPLGMVLFGVALTDGAVKSLDKPVLDYFPEYEDLRTPERMKIRLSDALSMTSGLHWD